MSADPKRVPISSSDRVSDVLARDEALVEVFVRHAPQFKQLRNSTMRRVMARLVTVEQAARMAGVDLELLVRELNDALDPAHAAGGTASSAAAPRAHAPPVAVAPPNGRPAGRVIVEVDVREDLRVGREPFSRIMAAVGALQPAEMLLVRAIFEPVPLLSALARRGFVHAAQQDGPEDWSVWFWRPDEAPAAPVAPTTSQPAAAVTPDGKPGDDSIIWLDVRGLEPPEPLMRTLRALETLPDGRQLVQLNVRVPQLLLPMLAERGFACEVDDSRADQVLVRIWRPIRA